MKAFALALFAVLILYVHSDAAILVFAPNGSYTTMPTLSAAATAPSASGKTVVVTTPLNAAMSNISSATMHSWPTDRGLEFKTGGSLGNSTTFRFSNYSPVVGSGQVYGGTGVVTGLKEAKPEWFGGGASGMQAAINSGAGKILITNSEAYTGPVYLPTWNVDFIGAGYPTLSSTTTAVFVQTNHGPHVIFQGLQFTGATPGIMFNQANTANSLDEYRIRDCIFSMNAGVYGISLVGSREGRISDCIFKGSGNGVYTSMANFRWLDNCTFIGNFTTGQTAISDNGFTQYSGLNGWCIGSYISNCQIMGYDIGVYIFECEDAEIRGSTIDYNNTNIKIIGQQGLKMYGGYIGGAQSTANPGVYIGPNSASHGDLSNNIMIVGVQFTGHYTGANFDNLVLDGATNVTVTNNSFTFWTRYGVSCINTCLLNDISYNQFSPLSGHGTNCVSITSADSSNRIANNVMIRVIGINPTFCNKYFIFTVPGLIHLGKCVYNNETRNISDVLSLLKQEMDNKEKQPGWRSAF